MSNHEKCRMSDDEYKQLCIIAAIEGLDDPDFGYFLESFGRVDRLRRKRAGWAMLRALRWMHPWAI